MQMETLCLLTRFRIPTDGGQLWIGAFSQARNVRQMSHRHRVWDPSGKVANERSPRSFVSAHLLDFCLQPRAVMDAVTLLLSSHLINGTITMYLIVHQAA